MLKQITIRECDESGILIGLKELLGRLPPIGPAFWVIRWATIIVPKSFKSAYGIDAFQIESKSRDPGGYVIDNAFLMGIANHSIQVIDGEFTAYVDDILSIPLVSLHCIDSTEWVITFYDESYSAQFS